MRNWVISAKNQFAVLGFLFSLVGSGVMGLSIILGRGGFHSPHFLIPYLTLVPAILLAGLLLSLVSVPLIQTKGEEDYAKYGLTLNILFAFIYVVSAVHFVG